MILYTWRAGSLSSDVQRETYLRPTVSGARWKELRVLRSRRGRVDSHLAGPLVPRGFPAPGLVGRRRCSAPLHSAARHFGSATCIGNPPDPS